MAILAILIAILFPVFQKAKERALDSYEISSLKQLSVSHGVYISNWDDQEPGSSVPIIASLVAPASLVASPLDPFPEGWANRKR